MLIIAVDQLLQRHAGKFQCVYSLQNRNTYQQEPEGKSCVECALVGCGLSFYYKHCKLAVSGGKL